MGTQPNASLQLRWPADAQAGNHIVSRMWISVSLDTCSVRQASASRR